MQRRRVFVVVIGGVIFGTLSTDRVARVVMEGLQKLLAAKKQEVAALKEAQQKNKYLRKSEVESLLEKKAESSPKASKRRSSPPKEDEHAKKQKVERTEEQQKDSPPIEQAPIQTQEIEQSTSLPTEPNDDTETKEQKETEALPQSEEELLQRAEEDPDRLIYTFFREMLRQWESDLASRPNDVKRTAAGKSASKAMKQCKDYIRPLFRLCKRREVPSDIRPNLVEIVTSCQTGAFVRAHDAYIRLAIGNAAWPIGVTMVGIHERTGREKINSNKQAHVMNNEAQRKYLTSVKRLISYAQSISLALPSQRVG